MATWPAPPASVIVAVPAGIGSVMVIRLDPAVKSMLPSFPSPRLSTVCVAPPLNSSAQRRAELIWIQTGAWARLASADEEQLHATVGLYELRAHARVRWRRHAQLLRHRGRGNGLASWRRAAGAAAENAGTTAIAAAVKRSRMRADCPAFHRLLKPGT